MTSQSTREPLRVLERGHTLSCPAPPHQAGKGSPTNSASRTVNTSARSLMVGGTGRKGEEDPAERNPSAAQVVLPRLKSFREASFSDKAGATTGRIANSFTPASPGAAQLKGSKASKGSGKGKRSSGSTAAALCLLGAMLAGATPQADAFTFRKEVSCRNSLCHSTTNLALPAVSFLETPDYINVPIRGPSCNFTAIREPKRRYNKEFPVDFRPGSPDDSLKDAITSAKMLKATLDAHTVGIKPKCNYECDAEFG